MTTTLSHRIALSLAVATKKSTRFAITCSALCVMAFSHAAQADITTGLVTHYEFNDDTTEADLGFNSLTTVNDSLTGTGTLSQVAGPGGSLTSGADFGNTSSDRRIVVAGAPDIADGDVSYSAWFKTTNTVDRLSIFHGRSNATGDVSHIELNDAKPNTFVRDNNDGSGDIDISHGSALGDGQWYHMAGIWNGTTDTLLLYVNGVLSNTGSASTGTVSIAGWHVGGRFDNGIVPFDGALADVRMYSRVLSAGDVAELYALGTPVPTPAALPAGLAMLGLAAMRRRGIR